MVMAWYNYHGEKPGLETHSNIPPYDNNKEPFYYDYSNEKWVYKDEMDNRNYVVKKRRANAYKNTKSDEEIIEEKLREGVDGYAESTYWGEEYEFNDIEN